MHVFAFVAAAAALASYGFAVPVPNPAPAEGTTITLTISGKPTTKPATSSRFGADAAIGLPTSDSSAATPASSRTADRIPIPTSRPGFLCPPSETVSWSSGWPFPGGPGPVSVTRSVVPTGTTQRGGPISSVTGSASESFSTIRVRPTTLV